ncbi:MAG: hypothetical protein ACM3X1_10450 [Ignavibacteriales bacterium]
MHVLRSCFLYIITLFVLGTLIPPLVPLADTETNWTIYVLAQLSAGTNLRPPNMATDPEELLESIGSPGNLMDSVLEEVRNTNTSETSVENSESDSYSQGENMILSHQIIPAKDFIHLYDTYPFAIAEGLISAKLPCESDNSTHLKVMIGQIPKLQPANLTIEKDLSRPGYMCLYNFEIQQDSTSNRNSSSVTDIVLFNTSDERTVLPNTSTFVIGVTKLYPLQNGTLPAA